MITGSGSGSSVVEQRFCKAQVVGSIPTRTFLMTKILEVIIALILISATIVVLLHAMAYLDIELVDR